jgi:hypothetical protein
MHISPKEGGCKYADGNVVKENLGLEPLSVDQTSLTEQSTFNYGAHFYEPLFGNFRLRSHRCAHQPGASSIFQEVIFMTLQ